MNDNLSPKNLANRLKSPTPEFWKKVRRGMMVCGGIGLAITAAPIALPAIVVSLSGYLVTAGIVGTTMASFTKEHKEEVPTEN